MSHSVWAQELEKAEATYREMEKQLAIVKHRRKVLRRLIQRSEQEQQYRQVEELLGEDFALQGEQHVLYSRRNYWRSKAARLQRLVDGHLPVAVAVRPEGACQADVGTACLPEGTADATGKEQK